MGVDLIALITLRSLPSKNWMQDLLQRIGNNSLFSRTSCTYVIINKREVEKLVILNCIALHRVAWLIKSEACLFCAFMDISDYRVT